VPRAGRAPAPLAVAVALWVAAHPAAAMQFQPPSTDGDVALISGLGEIVQGDADRLRAALGAVPAGKNIALLLDSPGGSVKEAALMGQMIRDGSVAVVIPQNSKCVSACFLLLAAAPRRFAASNALVGVHSASESGAETVNSLAVTTEMARAAAGFGVPPAILGKMVQTVPGRVEWLTHEDLTSMGVRLLDENGAPAPAPAPAPQQQAAVPPPPAPSQPPAATPRSAPAPTSAPPLRAPAEQVAIAEFRGAYFCAGPTTLSLRVLQASDSLHRRAVLAVGPTATNPQAGGGTFVLEGRLDLAGGVLDMQPVAGSSQPGGTAMIGLVGRSDDGGKTFAGRVTADITCTLFTLRRIR
jgi:hypothetical protein